MVAAIAMQQAENLISMEETIRKFEDLVTKLTL
jgi:hypothetical protein